MEPHTRRIVITDMNQSQIIKLVFVLILSYKEHNYNNRYELNIIRGTLDLRIFIGMTENVKKPSGFCVIL